VRGLLKYIQYRDTRDDHIPVAGGPDRWVDGGLGSCYQHILARLDDLSVGNRHAYCHAIMIWPDPEALSQVEGDPQARFVEAVRATLEEWEAWRQEHDPKPQVGHAHVILAVATEQAMTGERTPLYNNPAEIEAFKEIAGRQLDRVYEIEREPEREPPPLALEMEGP